ncbi:hypothetical protein SPBR_00978 [Sporothrix brasiliensis 5110]|uniref:ABM domain-containing protein n=1 Tax=Sporothrix brasiliensis 5110 TaxID=1398154 RepID=A0A0C2FID2_9PEZI|nr:uncharacterized protein SPBR_00978 [Sporothrix brasiliensis 5110]KIH90813.1 hypothetical protein SPBR_00978 [Sporothrix brasiliensis 5110]
MPKLVFAILPTVGGKVRDEYIAKLAATSAYAKAHEPGVLTYAVCLPRDEADQKTIYMIETYADQGALDAHMQIDLVKDMIAWMGGPAPVLEGAPTVLALDVVDDGAGKFGLFARPAGVAAAADPYIVVGALAYKDAALADKSLAYWADVAATTRADEPGSLVYALARSAAEPAKLYTLEAYESEAYLWETHAKSAAVQKNVADTKDWRAGLTHYFVKQVHGFLARS